MLTRQSYEHGSVSRRPGLWQPPEPHMSEVVFGRGFHPPDCDHAPSRLEELLDLVDLKGTGGVECIAEDFAVGNRTEDDAVLRDVVHGQDAGAGVTHIGDPAHELGGKQLQALGTIELTESRSKLGGCP